MNENKKTLMENFISMGALQIFTYVIPLITLPYQIRVIGSSNFGILAFALAFIQYFNIITDYGFSITAPKALATNRTKRDVISYIFNIVICSKTLLFFVCALIQIIAIIFVPQIGKNWLVFLFTFLSLIGWVLFPSWFFVGMEKSKYITILNIMSRTFFLVLLFVVVRKMDDYIYVPLLSSTGSIIAGLVGYFYAIREYKLKVYVPPFNKIIRYIRKSTPFFFANLSWVAYTSTNTFFLGLITTNALVGIFAAAYNLYNALSNIKVPISVALYPYMARFKDLKFYKKLLIFTMIVAFFSCIALFLMSKLIITIFYGKEMIQAYLIFRILVIAVLIEMISIFFDYPLLGVFGHMKTVSYITIFGAVFHLICLGILYITNYINITTVAILIVITTAVMLLLKLYFTYKYRIFSIADEKII